MPKLTTVLFLESTVRAGMMASILAGLTDVKNAQVVPNGKLTGIKLITSAAMIPNKWSKFNMYVTY